jgi:two-component system chemotaxis response regulator CheY
MGRIVRNLLLLTGFRHVDAVFDGASALMKLRERDYGLVISDWNMQPMTGHTLLEEIRADPSLKTIMFIMVTAESQLTSVVAAKEAGVDGYLVKPFNGETLKQKIAAAFASRQARNSGGNVTPDPHARRQWSYLH